MKEFKIIVGADAANTHIYVDNQPIGMVRDIKFHVGVGTTPAVEIVFPDLRAFSNSAAKKVSDQVELLKDLPQVKVTLAKVEFSKI